MSNLLPEEKKKAIKKELILRLFIVFFVFLFATISIAIILLTPARVVSVAGSNQVSNELEIYKKSILFKNNNLLSKSLDVELLKSDALQEEYNNVDINQLIDDIVKNKSTDIKIKGIFYEKISEIKKGEQEYDISLTVKGVAKKRSSLIDFINQLKNNKKFIEVDFPVSGLVKDENIDFSIKISGKSE
ncbi:hypothetical protein L6261_03745 [Candidatus Parcubacteria bacterium]|nr:hypothetical protein [Candidatus Parcubacteria bacterium]